MGKVVDLKQIKKVLKPHTATLVGGSFDLFHVGHLRYLRTVSKHGRPLVVIVQSDRGVRIRKGPDRPIITERHRAEIVAALSFVDYVLILSKPSHHDTYLETIQPKKIVFYNQNLAYRKRRAADIEKKYPAFRVVFETGGRRVMSTSRITKRVFKKSMMTGLVS